MANSVALPWRVLLAALHILPHRLLSASAGWASRRVLPGALQARMNRAFARHFLIDAGEAERPPEAYPTLSALFSRRLRDGARSWEGGAGSVASPADGILQGFGPLTEGTALQAKGLSYAVAELLGDEAEAKRFQSGAFLTVYLSPSHYHRVHGPCSARLRRARRIRGRLFPVNPGTAGRLPDLYVGNERVVALLESEGAHLAVVAVGALNVGSIRADFDPALNALARGAGVQSYRPPISLEAGAPLMTFRLGSTVVLLVSPKDGYTPRFRRGLGQGMELRAGAPVLELSPRVPPPANAPARPPLESGIP